MMTTLYLFYLHLVNILESQTIKGFFERADTFCRVMILVKSTEISSNLPADTVLPRRHYRWDLQELRR